VSGRSMRREDNRIVGHMVGERRSTVNSFFSADTMGDEAGLHRTVPVENIQGHKKCVTIPAGEAPGAHIWSCCPAAVSTGPWSP